MNALLIRSYSSLISRLGSEEAKESFESESYDRSAFRMKMFEVQFYIILYHETNVLAKLNLLSRM
jgi:hypothetical protein